MRPKTLTLLLCLLLTVSACQNKEEAAQAPPPPDIPVVVLQAQDVPLFMEFVGQVHGLKDIAMRARVEGFLEGIHFEEGSQVEEGKLLYTLESQPFEEAVANRMSQVAEAQTMLAKASSDLGRIKPLAELKAVSQSDLDGAVAQFEAAQAALDAAQANLRAARIQLGYTKVYSPINGIIGKTKAKVGDFVGREPNPVILNVVSQIDTVLVEFFLTENQYLEAARRFLAEAEGVESDERKAAVLELILSDGSLYPHKGKVDFIDRDVDPTTGAILLQASFPNPEGLLRPGQFAKVKVRVGNRQGRHPRAPALRDRVAGALQRLRSGSGQHGQRAPDHPGAGGGQCLPGQRRPHGRGPGGLRRPADGPRRGRGQPGGEGHFCQPS